MKLRSLAVTAALLASSSAFAGGALAPSPGASCTSSFSLGTMGPPATKPLGNSFTGTTIFSDCYDFSINAPANSSGTTTEVSSTFWLLPSYIDVLTVALYDAVGTKVGSTDLTPNSFAFSNLASGAYKLVVGGYTGGVFGSSSYSGSMSTSVAAVASPVPEGSLAGMLAMAMVGAALVARRSKRG